MKFLKVTIWSFLWVLFPLNAQEPLAIYLTWIQDPTSSMTVQWQASEGSASKLAYHLKGVSSWMPAEGETRLLSNTHVEVHIVTLEGLQEDSEYVFQVEGSEDEYRFRTMPKKLSRPVRAAVGGDVFYSSEIEVFHRMNRMIAYNDPDFVVIGGDLAYTKRKRSALLGRAWEAARWQEFLRELQRTLRGSDGRLIPFLPLIGNHDFKKLNTEPELFYEIFAFPEPQKSARALDFGDYLSLIMLDTDHSWPIEGDQTLWLEKTLEQKQDIPYLWAVYHVAAYPSCDSYGETISQSVRSNWVPLFDQYQVPVAFEHHNHCYKRTHPILNGQVNEKGTIYLGDGSWGVPVRRLTSPDNLWYLAKSESINACYIVTMTAERCKIEAKNSQNEVIDQLILKPRKKIK